MNHFCLVIIKDQLIVSSPCSNVPDARVKPVSRDLLTDRVIVIEEGIYLHIRRHTLGSTINIRLLKQISFSSGGP